MKRRTTALMEQEACAALADALDNLGLDVLKEWPIGNRRVDLLVEPAGIEIEVKVKPVITAAGGKELAQQGWSDPRTTVWVADRIASEAKRAFRESGVNFFDLRGELRIVQPPLFIDTLVDVREPYPPARSGPLDSQVAKETAIACLLTPDQPHGVRETARLIDRSPSAVSRAMAGLEQEGLLTSHGQPMVPYLFHELTTVWRRKPVALAKLPEPGFEGLEIGTESRGWTLTDTVAAQSWGIPVVAPGGYPPGFYVPGRTALRFALSQFGEATSPNNRACTIAIAPIRFACRHRFDHSETSGIEWPVANHIVVALDLAQDKARGLEMLEQWEPEGIARAW